MKDGKKRNQSSTKFRITHAIISIVTLLRLYPLRTNGAREQGQKRAQGVLRRDADAHPTIQLAVPAADPGCVRFQLE